MAARDKKRKLSAVTQPLSAADAPAADALAAGAPAAGGASETSRPRRVVAMTTSTTTKLEPAAEAPAPTKPAHASATTTVAASATAVPLAFTHQSVEASARAATAAAIAAATSRQRTRGDVDNDTDRDASSRRGSIVNVDSVFRDAKVHFLTSDEASWVYHVPRWYRAVYDAIGISALVRPPSEDADEDGRVAELPYSAWFDQIWALHPEHPGMIKMYGRDVLTPRFQQTYDMAIRFSGSTFEAKALPDVLRPCVETMQAMLLNPEMRASYLRGALLNWYADGEHYIGPHHDADKQFYLHSPVFSLSLGATRRFVFTVKRPPSKLAAATTTTAVERLELALEDGDLVVMGGTTQQTHKHALPKMKACRDKRVSITLRCFK